MDEPSRVRDFAKKTRVSDFRRDLRLENLDGDAALVAISLSLVASRMYPTLKYALGYGKACSKVRVAGEDVAPLALAA